MIIKICEMFFRDHKSNPHHSTRAIKQNQLRVFAGKLNREDARARGLAKDYIDLLTPTSIYPFR
jgi:hypothetical protein